MAELSLRLYESATVGPRLRSRVAAESSQIQPRADCIFDMVETRAAFDALERDWNGLFERAGRGAQVFQTFAWCWHWCNAFLAGHADTSSARLCIVTARLGRRLVLVLPLALESRAGIKCVVWLGEPVGQYGDVLVEDCLDRAALIEGAWAHLVSRVKVDLVHLRKVRADALIAPLLERLGAATWCGAAPCLDLSSAPDAEHYEERYSAKARKNRRRLMRRLEEQAPVSMRVLDQGAEASRLAVHAIALKRQWLKSRKMLSPALADSRSQAFFAAIAAGGERNTGARISVLEVGGVAAGIQVGFACKGRLNLHVIVYDLTYEKSGVGVLQIERCIRDAYAAGYHTIDLLAPNDGYKMDWADRVTEVRDYAMPLSLTGRLYTQVYIRCLRGRLKALAGCLPGIARGLVAVAGLG